MHGLEDRTGSLERTGLVTHRVNRPAVHIRMDQLGRIDRWGAPADQAQTDRLAQHGVAVIGTGEDAQTDSPDPLLADVLQFLDLLGLEAEGENPRPPMQLDLCAQAHGATGPRLTENATVLPPALVPVTLTRRWFPTSGAPVV